MPWLAALLAILLASPALFFGFCIDDWLHRLVLLGEGGELGFSHSRSGLFAFVRGVPAETRALRDTGFLPWWTQDDLVISFWRPVSVWTHQLDYALWPDSARLMHAHSLLWLGMCTVLAGVLYRRVMGAGWAAGLAVLLFAVEDAHAMPAGWIANRNGLIALALGITALIAHIRWRETRRAPYALLAGVMLGASLLSKEAGIATAAYLFAYAVFVDHGSRRHRLLSLAPYAVVIIGWRIVYRLLGHGIHGAELYNDPLMAPATFVRALFVRGPVLFLGQWAGPPADIHVLMPGTVQLAMTAAGLVLFVAVLWLVWPCLRRDAIARFWALGMLLSFVPICATFPSDRLLLFTGIGAFGLITRYVAWVARASNAEAPRPWLRFRHAGVWALLGMHLVLAAWVLPVRTAAFGVFGNGMNTILRGAPLCEDAAEKTVVLLDIPVAFFGSYLPLIRKADGLPVPRHVHSLAPNTGVMGAVAIARTGSRTLTLRVTHGAGWFLARERAHPVAPGDRFALPGLEIQIEEATAEGWPARVRFTFAHSLEHPDYVWLHFDKRTGRLRAWTPPAF